MGNEEIRYEKSQKYYSDLTRVNCTQNASGNVDDLNEKVSLKLSVAHIEQGCRYQIQLFNMFGQTKSPISEPEICTEYEGDVALCQKALLIQYYFEKEQPLLIEIQKIIPDAIPAVYAVSTTLGCIMGSRKNTLERNIPGLAESIVVKAEKIQQSEDILVLKLDVKSNVTVNYSEIKNKIIFVLSTGTSKVYKSECIDDLGNFQQVKIPAALLNSSTPNNSLHFTVYDCKKKVVCDTVTSVQELVNHKIFNIDMSKRRKFTCTSMSFLTRNYTFVDYLQAGVQIGLSVAIDFTGSNGLPKEMSSLHYIGGPTPNQYERAIYSCGNIVAYYDYDQLFPCYGFGANINGTPTPLFNLNLSPDPNIHTIPAIINEYHKALSIVRLWGPTHFGPILNATNNMIRAENNKLKYNILMILTDGMIDDVENTINELVNGSFLPLSVIIIGVGRADFSTMNVLDADENPLVASNGVRAARDLVQFVPFLKYENDPQRLAQEVLAEVPKQIMQYYEQNNLDPMKLTT